MRIRPFSGENNIYLDCSSDFGNLKFSKKKKGGGLLIHLYNRNKVGYGTFFSEIVLNFTTLLQILVLVLLKKKTFPYQVLMKLNYRLKLRVFFFLS